MNAGFLLSVGGLDAEQLLAELHPVDPAGVRVVAAPAVLRWMWPKRIGAMATRAKIYVDPPLLAGDPRMIKYLMVHELVHVRQWSDYGFFGFLRRYASEYIRGRRKGLSHNEAYRANRLEQEARQVEERFRTG